MIKKRIDMKNSKNVEIEKFYDKLSKNANLLKKIRNKKKNYKDLNEFTKKVILPISKKSGHNFSVKDLIEYEKKALLSNKNPEITPISDEKLSDASGGVGKKTLTSLSLVVAATPISAGIFSPTSQTASAVGEADQEQGTQAVAAQERAEVTNPTWEAFKRKYQ
ncbi:MAG: hypothetical protein LBF33_02995, partial [Oscillospiraceae bacterium]|nr:hypothetical protein [Oscillospiraceae bacterium]